TGLIDIFPTFCDLLGLEKPSHLDGSSFAPRLKDPSLEGNSAAFSRFGRGDTIRTDFFRFTNYGKSGTMLYDHRNDPSENTNISSSHSKESKDLNLRLQKEIRRTKMLN
ncbi:MAG: iduronate sulfatase, partial [Akkermansiaceae bacterium]